MNHEELKKIVNLHEQWLLNPKHGKKADLERANLEIANLRGADLEEANLSRSDLGGANLEGANLRGANLRGAKLRGANLERANLEGADLEGANLREAELLRTNLRGADLEGANLRGADLEEADLRGANLRDTGVVVVQVYCYLSICTPDRLYIGCQVNNHDHWRSLTYKEAEEQHRHMANHIWPYRPILLATMKVCREVGWPIEVQIREGPMSVV